MCRFQYASHLASPPLRPERTWAGVSVCVRPSRTGPSAATAATPLVPPALLPSWEEESMQETSAAV